MKRNVLIVSIILSVVLLLSISQMTASASTSPYSSDDNSSIVERPHKTDDGGSDQTNHKDKQATQQAAKETQQADKLSAKETKQAEKDARKETKQAEKAQKKKHFKGTIESVSAESISVLLKDGTSVSIAISADTRIKIAGKQGATTADLTAGMQVTVRAVQRDDVLTALSISVVPGKPVKLHRVGIVSEYTAGVSITVQAKDGSTTTFAIDPEVKILPAHRADSLGVGSTVTIICPRNPSASSDSLPVAVGIVIHDNIKEEDVADDVEIDDEPTEVVETKEVEETEVEETEEPTETAEPTIEPTETSTPEAVEP